MASLATQSILRNENTELAYPGQACASEQSFEFWLDSFAGERRHCKTYKQSAISACYNFANDLRRQKDLDS